MRTYLRRSLQGALISSGLLVLGATAAHASTTTSGEDGLLSGTQIVAPITAPVTLGTIQVPVLTRGDTTATGTTQDPAPAPSTASATTSGEDGLLSGTQVIAPITAPVTTSTIQAPVLTRGDTTTASAPAVGVTGGRSTEAGAGAATTSGEDGLLSGTQVIAPITAPVTTSTIQAPVLTRDDTTTASAPAAGVTPANGTANGAATSGEDGLLSGTQVIAPITAPVTLGTIQAPVLTRGDTTTSSAPAATAPALPTGSQGTGVTAGRGTGGTTGTTVTGTVPDRVLRTTGASAAAPAVAAAVLAAGGEHLAVYTSAAAALTTGLHSVTTLPRTGGAPWAALPMALLLVVSGACLLRA